jgi:hypothetical protein
LLRDRSGWLPTIDRHTGPLESEAKHLDAIQRGTAAAQIRLWFIGGQPLRFHPAAPPFAKHIGRVRTTPLAYGRWWL